MKFLLGFLNQAQEVSSESSLAVTSGGQTLGNDLFFYIKGIIYDISANNYIIGGFYTLIMVIGLIVMFYMFGGTFKNSFYKIRNTESLIYKYPVPAKIFYVFIIISFLMIFASFFTASLPFLLFILKCCSFRECLFLLIL